MALDLLLGRCLVPGQTSFKERALGAQLRPQNDETILVFHSDTPDFRKCFGLGNEARVSDAIFFYRSKQRRPLLLFLELKGNHVRDAVEQLLSTVRTVKTRIRRDLHDDLDYLALVVTSGSAPAKNDPALRKFDAEARMPLRIKSFPRGGGSVDLRDYLS